MRRFAARARYAFGSALRGFRASPVASGVAVVTVAVTLLLAGAFTLLLGNMERLIDRFGEDLKLAVYLERDLDEAATERLGSRLLELDAVEAVVFISQDEALERFRSGVGARTGLLEGLEDNPLPASFELRLRPGRRDAAGLQEVTRAISDWPGIDEVGAGAEWVEGYARTLGLLRTVGTGVGIALALASLLIVANTIRLALYARRNEIEILRLVGATPGFVAAPFLLEGVMQGALGGAIAVALLFGAFQLMRPVLTTGLSFLLGYSEPVFLGSASLSLLIGGGAVVGLLGAFLAVTQQRHA